jgi:hypothetical protein
VGVGVGAGVGVGVGAGALHPARVRPIMASSTMPQNNFLLLKLMLNLLLLLRTFYLALIRPPLFMILAQELKNHKTRRKSVKEL